MKKLLVSLLTLFILVILTLCIVVVTINNKYLKKTDYDYVSSISYNGVSVVGEDGEFYLCKNGKCISEKYSWIKALNDSVSSESLLNPDSDAKLYNYYIGQKTGFAEYYLFDTDGNEYVIDGENYTFISEGDLPILTFKNQANNAFAALSLDALNSDLSKITDNRIILNEFSSLSNGIPDCLIGSNYDRGLEIKHVFDACGKLIVSGSNIKEYFLTDTDENGKTKREVLLHSTDTGELYSVDSGKISDGVKSIYQYSGGSLVCRVEDGNGNLTKRILIGVGSVIYIPAVNDSSLVYLPKGVIVKGHSIGKDSVILVNAEPLHYDRLELSDGVWIGKNDDSDKYAYIDSYGRFLFEHSNGALVLNRSLSYGDDFVFDVPSEDANRKIIIVSVKNGSREIQLTPSQTLKNLHVDDGAKGSKLVPVYTISETLADGRVRYRLYTPFADKTQSKLYDSIVSYEDGGILYALAADREGGSYEIIDVTSNSVVFSHSVKREDFAKVQFTKVSSVNLVTDTTSKSSVLPVSIVKMSYINSGKNIESSSYFALYRRAIYGSEAYLSAPLELVDLGNDLDQSDPISKFEYYGRFATNSASGSTIYCVGEGMKLVPETSIDHSVTGIIQDVSDPSVIYATVRNKDGKYGLYTTSGVQVVAPYYSKVSFVDGEYVCVSKNGAYGVLRCRKGKVKTAVEFKYSYISYCTDGAFVCKDASGNYCMYEGDKIILDKPLQNISYGLDITETEEGYKTRKITVFTFDGVIYTHTADNAYSLNYANIVDKFDLPENTIPEGYDLNNRATVVYYYKGTTFIGFDVIFKDSSSKDAFLNGNTVYDSQGENVFWRDPTTVLVTKEDILNMADYSYFITLNCK